MRAHQPSARQANPSLPQACRPSLASRRSTVPTSPHFVRLRVASRRGADPPATVLPLPLPSTTGPPSAQAGRPCVEPPPPASLPHGQRGGRRRRPGAASGRPQPGQRHALPLPDAASRELAAAGLAVEEAEDDVLATRTSYPQSQRRTSSIILFSRSARIQCVRSGGGHPRRPAGSRPARVWLAGAASPRRLPLPEIQFFYSVNTRFFRLELEPSQKNRNRNLSVSISEKNRSVPIFLEPNF